MHDLDKAEELLQNIFLSDGLISATLSSPKKMQIFVKASVRILNLGKEKSYQVSEYDSQKVFHKNLNKEMCFKWLREQLELYKQCFLFTQSGDYHLLIGKKNNLKILKKPPTHSLLPLSHNRQKEYLLEEGNPIAFLIHLGVMNEHGKVLASKRDKFKQINRFLEMIEDVLSEFTSESTLRIIDFGCGKAYLTFALYYFLKIIRGYEVQLMGLDLKKDVISFCHDLSCKLGYQKDLKFIHGDIQDFESSEEIDLVVSLHACDTATDIALEKAIEWKAKVILCVPCCQHELNQQIKQESLRPLLKHGILKERFAALATDAARAQLLDMVGYHTQILEFIDMEHTPKNLLIRAVKRQNFTSSSESLKSYLEYKKLLSINPFLEKSIFQILSEKEGNQGVSP